MMKTASIKLPINYETANWTTMETARELYIEKQEGLCWYCGEALKGAPAKAASSKYINLLRFPPNFFKHPVHLHHCRSTGLSIGAVHSRCSAILREYHSE